LVVGAVTAAELTTTDGVRLAARWWHPPARTGERGHAIVVVHGFCGRKDDSAVELVARRQAAAGRHVLTFDLRGHGASGGETTMGWREGFDVDAAVAAARAVADAVVVVGSSMGGVACIEHLTTTGRPQEPWRADAAVLVATPARWSVPRSARGVMAMALTQTSVGRAVAARRMGTRIAVRPGRGPEPAVRVGDVTRPVAVVHGLDDRFIGPTAAQTLYAALRGPRLIDLVAGMGHGLSDEAAAPIDAAVDWALSSLADVPAATNAAASAEPDTDRGTADPSGMADA
jgi:pimeloyl-ACP methyl ester carboxylesterase